MNISPKTLLAVTAVSILMAGAGAPLAQEVDTPVSETDQPVVEETLDAVETLDTSEIEIITRDGAEETAAEGKSLKIVEDVETVDDANKIDAVSETEIPAEATETDAEAAEDTVEDDSEPQD